MVGPSDEDDLDFFLRKASEADGMAAANEMDPDIRADWLRAAFSWRLLAESTLVQRAAKPAFVQDRSVADHDAGMVHAKGLMKPLQT